MNYKIYNRQELRPIKILKCEQEDNIERNGYMSTEQLYQSFTRAGINQMEWLKKAYPEKKATNEQILADGEVLEKGINPREADVLDIMDASRKVDKNIKQNKKELENMKKTQEEIIQEMARIEKEEKEKTIKNGEKEN